MVALGLQEFDSRGGGGDQFYLLLGASRPQWRSGAGCSRHG